MNLLHTPNLPPALPPMSPPTQAGRGGHYHLSLDLGFKASLKTWPMTTKWLGLEPGTQEAFRIEDPYILIHCVVSLVWTYE